MESPGAVTAPASAEALSHGIGAVCCCSTPPTVALPKDAHRLASHGAGELGPPYTPRPRPQQKWVHSCCSVSKLEAALRDPDVSAIEADIMMLDASKVVGSAAAGAGRVPTMAHPTLRGRAPASVDLTFADFLERCLADGTRHLKLDFKDPQAVEPCLELLASRWSQLHTNGQAVWLNADILPGPNARSPARVPADTFVPLCRRLCPHAVLSLGWCVGPIGPEEAYSEADIVEMHQVCARYDLPGSSVVFASSLRLAERAVPLMAQLLAQVADSQMLLWTGTGELPVAPALQTRVAMQLASLGFGERVGFDVAIARSCCALGTAGMIDCTFFWSRWTRWLCAPLCCPASTPRLQEASRQQLGERQPLVRARANGECTPASAAPTPQRISTTELASV